MQLKSTSSVTPRFDDHQLTLELRFQALSLTITVQCGAGTCEFRVELGSRNESCLHDRGKHESHTRIPLELISHTMHFRFGTRFFRSLIMMRDIILVVFWLGVAKGVIVYYRSGNLQINGA